MLENSRFVELWDCFGLFSKRAISPKYATLSNRDKKSAQKNRKTDRMADSLLVEIVICSIATVSKKRLRWIH